MNAKHESQNVKSLKNLIRARTLGTPKLRRKEAVELEISTTDGESEAVTFLLIQPSIDEKAEIYRRLGITKAEEKTDSSFNMARLQVAAVVACAHAPSVEGEAPEKVYTLADEPELLAMPSCRWFDELSKKSLELLNYSESAAKKDFAPTETSASST
ncbi:MAG: hypothetical protein ACK4N5_22785 [Myxococcales bacterium]